VENIQINATTRNRLSSNSSREEISSTGGAANAQINTRRDDQNEDRHASNDNCLDSFGRLGSEEVFADDAGGPLGSASSLRGFGIRSLPINIGNQVEEGSQSLDVSIPSPSQATQPSLGVQASPQRSADGKEMIRVRANEISKDTTQGSSGWFWNKSTVKPKPEVSAKSGGNGVTGKKVESKGDAEKKIATAGKKKKTSSNAGGVTDGSSETGVLSSVNQQGQHQQRSSDVSSAPYDSVVNSTVVNTELQPTRISDISHANSASRSVTINESVQNSDSEKIISSRPQSISASHNNSSNVSFNSVVSQSSSHARGATDLPISVANDVVAMPTKSILSTRNAPSDADLSLSAQQSFSSRFESHASSSDERITIIKSETTSAQTSSTSLSSQSNLTYQSASPHASVVENVTSLKLDHQKVEETHHKVVSKQFSSDSITMPSALVEGHSNAESTRRGIDQLQREKAKLEGRIEVLQSENKEMLSERAELQSKVATLTQTLRY